MRLTSYSSFTTLMIFSPSFNGAAGFWGKSGNSRGPRLWKISRRLSGVDVKRLQEAHRLSFTSFSFFLSHSTKILFLECNLHSLFYLSFCSGRNPWIIIVEQRGFIHKITIYIQFVKYNFWIFPEKSFILTVNFLHGQRNNELHSRNSSMLLTKKIRKKEGKEETKKKDALLSKNVLFALSATSSCHNLINYQV